ncbi:iron chelate uptake ABC transporter family permease subunit [Micromonospora sp. NPDC049523]|uniref:FecCD family ABC transporter permease n=1 Tax=Micromonospora sp. NPDC049523 TaxID=3155921 RepID=UPI00341787C3
MTAPRVLHGPGRIAVRYHRRSAATVAVLLLGCAVIWAVTMSTGEYALGPGQVWHVLTGGGDRTSRLIVLDLRLPRTVAALLVGMALGLSGAIFQSLSRNPLGSPDIIGFTTGSASGALVVLLVVGETSGTLVFGTLLGGFATAIAVYLLAYAQGIHGQRLILVGIGIGAMLASVNDYLLTRAELEQAQAAKTWLFGSLNAIAWRHVVPLAVALAVLVPVTMALGPRLRALELGDDIAAGLGVPVNRSRLMLLLCGVTLAAAAITAAGPIGFLALAAPQLARRLTRAPSMPLIPSAMMGALLLLGADLLAQRALAPFQIPVGLVTGALGGGYLMWLLTRGATRRP